MKNFLLILLLTPSIIIFSQSNLSYRLPPKEIVDLLLAKPTPNVSADDKGEWMLFTESNSYPSVAELAKDELRIAGLRIDPRNFSPSRQNFINNIWLKNILSGKEYKISGLPSNLKAGNLSWSPDNKKIAFTQTSDNRVDLYVVDVASQKVVKVNKQPLNIVLGGIYQWYDNRTLLYKIALKPASAAPAKPLMPLGPAVQENLGKVAASRTYEDLIRSAYDEQLFEFFATAQLVKNVNGVETKIGPPAIYSTIAASPDKKYLLIRVVKKPFSYLVPAFGFPSVVAITDINGKMVKQLAELPSAELAPVGFDNVQNVPRGFDWRDDEPATVVWATPLDSGIIKKKVDYHDAVYSLTAPFITEPKELFRTQMRYRGIQWGNASLALVVEALIAKQITRTNRYNPSTNQLEKLWERNTTDAYSNPGFAITEKINLAGTLLKRMQAATRL